MVAIVSVEILPPSSLDNGAHRPDSGEDVVAVEATLARFARPAAAGKAISKMNAFKHGARSAWVRQLSAMLRRFQDSLDQEQV